MPFAERAVGEVEGKRSKTAWARVRESSARGTTEMSELAGT